MKTYLVRVISSDDVSQRINCSRSLLMALMAIGICLATALSALAQEADRTELPKSIAKKLQKNVIPQLLAGNNGAFQSQLATIISKLQPESFEQIEAFGQANNVNSFYRAFYTAWRDDVSQGSVPADLKMRRPIALYLTSGTTKEIERLLAELQNHDLMNSTEVPENWLESRNFFLDVQSLVSRLSELQMMGEFVNATLEPYRESGKISKGEAGEILDRFQTAAESFATAKKQAIEKEAILRLQRVNTAAEAMLNPGDFETDFVSALFVEQDAVALEFFFENTNAPDAEELSQPGLVETTIATIVDIRNSGSSVVEKAKLLSQGLQAWKRGRYGVGALGNGLLKASLFPNSKNSQRAAQTSDDSLRMPENAIAISQFLGSDSGPGYDRRHYYTWDLEYRPLLRSYGSSSDRDTQRETLSVSPTESQQLTCTNGQPYTLHSTDVEFQETTTDVTTSTINREWAAQDDSIPPRIVGTQEYSAAIVYLERLVGMSSEEEIEVYDKVIAQLPEFVFYSGMTAGIKQLTPFAGNNPIQNIAEAKPQDVADSQFKKQSLAWLMALAKVELNATRSMYVPGNVAFIAKDDAEFGLQEYYHVLLDDVAAHLQAIDTDDQFKKAIKKSLKDASSETVAYLRRLKLISSMLIALERSGDPMIAEKSAEYRETIDAYNTTLEAQAVRSAQDLVFTNRRVSTETKQETRSRIETH